MPTRWRFGDRLLSRDSTMGHRHFSSFVIIRLPIYLENVDGGRSQDKHQRSSAFVDSSIGPSIKCSALHELMQIYR